MPLRKCCQNICWANIQLSGAERPKESLREDAGIRMHSLLENVNGPAAGYARRNKFAEVVCIRFGIEKAGAQEGD